MTAREQERHPECWKSQLIGVSVWPFVWMQIYFKWRSKRVLASAFRSGLQHDRAKPRSFESWLSYPPPRPTSTFFSLRERMG